MSQVSAAKEKQLSFTILLYFIRHLIDSIISVYKYLSVTNGIVVTLLSLLYVGIYL